MKAYKYRIIILGTRQDIGKIESMNVMNTIRHKVKKIPPSRGQTCISTGIDETTMHRIIEKNGACMAETSDKLICFGCEPRKKKEDTI